jgi:hypothetical protein
MKLITKKSELLENLARLQNYLQQPGVDRDFALELIKQGICFIVVEQDGKLFFGPSRFVGYKSNNRHDHVHSDDKDGRETNVAIEAILGTEPAPSDVLESEYEHFSLSLGSSVRKAPFGTKRKFWDLR